jgi:hypothetical protein
MGMSNVSEEEMESARSPGVVEVLREGVSIATNVPILFGLYVITAIAVVISVNLSSFVSIIVTAIGTLVAYKGMGKNIDTEGSRLVLIVYTFFAGLIAGILGGLATLLLVIPGIYVTLRFQFTTAAVMLEERGPISGLQQSWAISSGNVWTIFGVAVVFFVISLVFWGGSILATGGIPTGTTTEVIQGLSNQIVYGSAVQSVLLGPVQLCCTVYMYEAFRAK